MEFCVWQFGFNGGDELKVGKKGRKRTLFGNSKSDQ